MTILLVGLLAMTPDDARRDFVDRENVELGQHGRGGAGGTSLASGWLCIQAGTAEETPVPHARVHSAGHWRANSNAATGLHTFDEAVSVPIAKRPDGSESCGFQRLDTRCGGVRPPSGLKDRSKAGRRPQVDDDDTAAWTKDTRAFLKGARALCVAQLGQLPVPVVEDDQIE